MAVLTVTEMENIAFDRANINTTTDAPITAGGAESLRFLNDAYRDVWELSGGAAKRVAHATAWNEAADQGTGVVTGLLTDVGEILRVWVSLTSGSVGRTNGDVELVKVEPARLSHLRSWGGMDVDDSQNAGNIGRYLRARVYTAYRADAAGVAADANKFTMETWPAKLTVYYPIEYLPQLTPFTGGTDKPNVTDIESADIALLAAARMAPLVGRGDLVQSILMDISERTQRGLERKIRAMLAATQDR